MTEQEYLKEITDIRDQIVKSDWNDVEERLEALYKFKPVRLLWHVTKGEYIFSKTGDGLAAWNIIKEKQWPIYNYPGIEEFYILQRKILEQWNAQKDIVKIDLLHKILCEKTSIYHIDGMDDMIQDFMSDPDDMNKLEKLSDKYYSINDNIMYFALYQYMVYKKYKKEDKSQWFYQLPNMTYYEEVLADKDNPFIIVMEDYNQAECDILSYVLSDMGHKVFILSTPMEMGETEKLDLEATLKISMDNIQEFEDTIVIPPISAVIDGQYIDNRSYIIDFICSNRIDKNLATILCSGKLIEDLCWCEKLQKKIDRLSASENDLQEDRFQYGWVGSYTSYISRIYNYDVTESLTASDEVDFSIVIPARNSIDTLKYTLKTCLGIKFSGTYEIVLSDNSTYGNTEIHDLYVELKDSRIRYFRPTRELSLSKSFEFAYLCARGNFVFAIGSDDAVLPWSLDVLADIIKKYPADDIIVWERGFYAWPGFNKGQENELVIPRKYIKSKYNEHYIDRVEYLARVFKNHDNMYSLPSVYLNSGCKRKYFTTIIERTGRLWDGCNQDTYMGIINVGINEKILNIEYPITIAGMSGRSLGYNSGKPKKSNSERDDIMASAIKGDNIGIHLHQKLERSIPSGATNNIALYHSILRAIERGALSYYILSDVLDMKAIFSECLSEISILDEEYDRLLHYARYQAYKQGKEFLEWFDTIIYSDQVMPRYINTENKLSNESKTYKVGENSLGGEIIDASDYNVTNIYEAVELFKEKTCLL